MVRISIVTITWFLYLWIYMFLEDVELKKKKIFSQKRKHVELETTLKKIHMPNVETSRRLIYHAHV